MPNRPLPPFYVGGYHPYETASSLVGWLTRGGTMQQAAAGSREGAKIATAILPSQSLRLEPRTGYQLVLLLVIIISHVQGD